MANPSVQLSTWAERVPAAIAKAEGLLGPIWAPGDDGAAISSLFVGGEAITRIEVALARALWVAERALHDEFGGPVPPREGGALRAFVEKMEAQFGD